MPLGHPCQNSPVARWPVSAEDRAPRRSHTYGYAPSSTTADSVSLAPLDTSLSQRARSEFCRCVLGVLAILLGGCAYPEVAIVNHAAEHVLLKDLSFRGCAWASVLAYGEATSPRRCLPGEDRIHFRRLDAASYCRDQAEDGTIEGVCPCEPDTGEEVDSGLINVEPNWFAYQTRSTRRVEPGEFYLFEITLDEVEQDFSVPGPYGH